MSEKPMEAPSSPIGSPFLARKALDSDPNKTCSLCSKIWDVPLSICRCEQVRYCDRDCQRKAWPEHKRKCRLKSDQGKEFTKFGIRASFLLSLYSNDDVGEMTTDQVVLNYVLRDTVFKDSSGSIVKSSLLEILRALRTLVRHHHM
jgi:MYND finger